MKSAVFEKKVNCFAKLGYSRMHGKYGNMFLESHDQPREMGTPTWIRIKKCFLQTLGPARERWKIGDVCLWGGNLPTFRTLNCIKKYLVQGSEIGLWELCAEDFNFYKNFAKSCELFSSNFC